MELALNGVTKGYSEAINYLLLHQKYIELQHGFENISTVLAWCC